MAEIGEEMCQAEFAHHANKCPEYFCSRPEKNVHLYRKALALNTEKKPASDVANAEGCLGTTAEAPAQVTSEVVNAEVAPDTSAEAAVKATKKALATKPSDLELYERRCAYTFLPGAAVTPRLPSASSPEDQVASCRL